MMLARQPGREAQPGFTGIGRIEANENILQRTSLHSRRPECQKLQREKFGGCFPMPPGVPGFVPEAGIIAGPPASADLIRGQTAGGRSTILGWALQRARMILQQICSEQPIAILCNVLNSSTFQLWVSDLPSLLPRPPTIADECGENAGNIGRARDWSCSLG